MSTKVLNFVEKRKEMIETKRRSFERIMFQTTLGAYSVVDTKGGVFAVDLVDVSYDGCLFEIPYTPKATSPWKVDDEVTIRMYFTKKSFIPVVLKVKNIRESVKDRLRFMQFGCEFDKSLPSFEAMESFIKFLYQFAEHSTIDKNSNNHYFFL